MNASQDLITKVCQALRTTAMEYEPFAKNVEEVCTRLEQAEQKINAANASISAQAECLRDHFAGLALNGFLSSMNGSDRLEMQQQKDGGSQILSEAAYNVANAMIKERAKRA